MTDEDAIRREIDAIRPEDDDSLLKRAKELEAGAGKIDLELPEPPTQEQIAARLEPLRERLESSRREATEPQGEDMRETYRGTAAGLEIAYLVLGTPMIAWLVGLLLEGTIGGAPWSGYLVIVGAVAGVALAIHRLTRQNQGK